MSAASLSLEASPDRGNKAAGLKAFGRVAYAPATHRIVGLLGRGGMGKVLLARRRHSSLVRAVKFSRDVKPIGAAALLGLRHINLARVFSVRRLGRCYATTMEHVAGRTWRKLVEDHGPLSPALSAWLGAQAAAALAALHRHGWLHRDVQPQNLMVDHRGVVKLVDFDLMCPLEGADGAAPSVIAGTPDFAAPDQFRTAPLTDRSDVYGLGCTLYFLLTGQAPYAAADRSTLQRMLDHARLPVPDVGAACPHLDADLAALLTAMLSKSPDERPSAEQAAARLARASARLGAGVAVNDDVSRKAEKAMVIASETEALGAERRGGSKAGREETVRLTLY